MNKSLMSGSVFIIMLFILLITQDPLEVISPIHAEEYEVTLYAEKVIEENVPQFVIDDLYNPPQDTTEDIEETITEEPIIPQTTYVPITESFYVESEGVSSYYKDTVIYPARNGESTVYTSTNENGNCIGTTDYVTWYSCVVLPESLADTYGRGDTVKVSYNDVIYDCIVIDFNQEIHGNTINGVGEFTYVTGEVAYLVEEE